MGVRYVHVSVTGISVEPRELVKKRRDVSSAASVAAIGVDVDRHAARGCDAARAAATAASHSCVREVRRAETDRRDARAVRHGRQALQRVARCRPGRSRMSRSGARPPKASSQRWRFRRDADGVKQPHRTRRRRGRAEGFQLIFGSRRGQPFDHRDALAARCADDQPDRDEQGIGRLARDAVNPVSRNRICPRRCSSRCSPQAGARPVMAQQRSMKSP